MGTVHDVAIVGGGAAGVLVASALARRAEQRVPISVVLVDPSARPGAGLAYGTAEPHHLLNNVADRMSVHDEDPLHFVRWCATHGLAVGAKDFAPRSPFGRYLREQLEALRSVPGFDVVQGAIVGLDETGPQVRLTVAGGTDLTARTVVLALGNPPPVLRRADLGPRTTMVADPWAPRALDPVGARSRVLLLGTGLTMVDVATTLARRHARLRMTATSRHGLLPRVHSRTYGGHGPGIPPQVTTLRGVVREVAQQVESRPDGDWRPVVDGIRPQIGDLWAGFSPADRERFVRHLARRWEVHRHRMAPQVADEIDLLRASGRLRIVTGVDDGAYDVVVNCTGSRSVSDAGWNPLVDSLLHSGAIRPDPLGLGLDLDSDGAVVGVDGSSSGRVFAIGLARRGLRWESAAVPEIRRHADELATRLSGRRIGTGRLVTAQLV